MRYRYRRTTFLWVIGLAMPIFGPALPAAHAQTESLADWQAQEKAGGYDQPKPSDKKVSFLGASKAIYSGTFENAGDEQLFADLYEKRFFPLVTRPDVRGTRDDPIGLLRGNFRQLRPNTPVFDKLTDITLAYMVPLATDTKQHPAVRENAILAIGEVKSPKAVVALMLLIQDKDKKLHPLFKVAAMAGLVHLAEQGVLSTPAVYDPVVSLMEKYAGASGRNQPDWVRWVRGQAADVLGAIGSVGTSGQVPDALLKMVEDKELPLVQRGKAARALGRLKYAGTLPNAKAYANAFASFGSDALADNLPGDARRIWTVTRDFVEGLTPLKAAGSAPKVVEMYNAMDTLRKAASKGSPAKLPSEEELKPAVAAAKAVLDAAAGVK